MNSINYYFKLILESIGEKIRYSCFVDANGKELGTALNIFDHDIFLRDNYHFKDNVDKYEFLVKHKFIKIACYILPGIKRVNRLSDLIFQKFGGIQLNQEQKVTLRNIIKQYFEDTRSSDKKVIFLDKDVENYQDIPLNEFIDEQEAIYFLFHQF